MKTKTNYFEIIGAILMGLLFMLAIFGGMILN